MPVEDTFSIAGRGTVVTGRIETGIIKPGDEAQSPLPMIGSAASRIQPTRVPCLSPLVSQVEIVGLRKTQKTTVRSPFPNPEGGRILCGLLVCVGRVRSAEYGKWRTEGWEGLVA